MDNSDGEIKISFCNKIKNFLVSSTCCITTENNIDNHIENKNIEKHIDKHIHIHKEKIIKEIVKCDKPHTIEVPLD